MGSFLLPPSRNAPRGQAVTKSYATGELVFILEGTDGELNVPQIVALFSLLDPVVREALLKEQDRPPAID
jgi:hypothetical protein